MTSDLRFVFEEKDGILWIHDRTSPDKKWFCRLGLHGEVVRGFWSRDPVAGFQDRTFGESAWPESRALRHRCGGAVRVRPLSTYPNLARTAPPGWEKKNDASRGADIGHRSRGLALLTLLLFTSGKASLVIRAPK